MTGKSDSFWAKPSASPGWWAGGGGRAVLRKLTTASSLYHEEKIKIKLFCRNPERIIVFSAKEESRSFMIRSFKYSLAGRNMQWRTRNISSSINYTF